MNISLGKAKPLFAVIVAAVIGMVLQTFGLDIPTEKIEQAVEESIPENIDAVLPPATDSDQSYQVVSVIDGDTIIVKKGSKEETVRVLGIDAQESTGSIRGQECFGDEGKEYAQALLQNTTVTLSADPSQDERDKYERLLAYVGMSDGRDFGQVMIADGYAFEYTFKGRSYKNQALYQKTQSEAESEQAGLWGVCDV